MPAPESIRAATAEVLGQGTPAQSAKREATRQRPASAVLVHFWPEPWARVQAWREESR